MRWLDLPRPRCRTSRQAFVFGSLVTVMAVLLSMPAAGVPASYFTAARDEALNETVPDGEADVPWFERIQLRASIDDSDQNAQSYAARLRLKTPSQISAEKQILALQASRNSAESSVVFSAALERRFLLLIDLRLHQQQQELAAAQQRLAQRGVNARRAAIGSEAFRPAALQQAELRLSASRRQLRLATRRLERTRKRVAALLPGGDSAWPEAASEAITLDDMVPIAALAADLESANSSVPDDAAGQNPEMQRALLEANIAREQLARERGRSGLGVRFVELRHSLDDNNRSGDNRITIGIDMPLGKTFASSSRQLQRNEAEYRIHRLHRRQHLEREQVEGELALLLEEYQIEQDSIADISHRLARHNRSAPIALTLALQRQRLDRRERQAQLQADIYRSYIAVLRLRGLLAAEPLRNWLVAGQPVL